MFEYCEGGEEERVEEAVWEDEGPDCAGVPKHYGKWMLYVKLIIVKPRHFLLVALCSEKEQGVRTYHLRTYPSTG